MKKYNCNNCFGKYIFFGALFGTLFPIFSTVMDCYFQYGYITLKTLIAAQQNNHLLWVIDTAPLFLGFFAGIGGTKQDKINKYSKDLEKIIADRTKEVLYIAKHDDLTGLANRKHFVEHLEQAIKLSKRNSSTLALLFVDLDNFKEINDSLGHKAGDDVLKIIAQRIQNQVRESDLVARLGGDEFLVLLNDVTRPEYTITIADSIIKEVNKGINGSDTTQYISCSIGISFYPLDSKDAETLINHADMAMYAAKRNGKNNIKIFNKKRQKEVRHYLSLRTDLQNALIDEQLHLHYQPQYTINNELIGMEALMRWKCPKRGNVMPEEFITIAEETGLIIPMGFWGIHEACRQTVKWIEKGYNNLRIAVNLSPKQFLQENLVREIEYIIHDTGIDPRLLEVEITESCMINDIPKSIDILQELDDMGITLALDDFGTGYSSLLNLLHLPFSVIKIDKTFIGCLSEKKKSTALVNAIVNMAKSLDIRVIAEGVETVEQHEILKELGCDILQGYLFNKPLMNDDFENLLHENSKIIHVN